MLEKKIQEIQEEIQSQEKNISAAKDIITEKEREIIAFEALQQRLQKIYSIRHIVDTESMERIAELGNSIKIHDFLSVIAKVADLNVGNYSVKMMPLMNLTIWQGLYLFFGDQPGDKKESPAEAGEEREPN